MNAAATKAAPWQTTLAALVSLALFSVADGFSVVVGLLAVALPAVYVLPARLKRGTPVMRLTRLVLYGAMFALNSNHVPLLSDTWMTAVGLDRFGPLLAAEMVLRAWSAPPDSRQMLLLSGFIVLGGCSTPDARIGLFFVPVYFLAVIFALRADRSRPPGEIAPRLRRSAAVLLALGLGASAGWAFRVYKDQIMALGEGTFAAAPHRTDAPVSGIEKDPQLGPTFDSPGSSSRIYRIEGDLPDPHLHGMAFDAYVRGAWKPSLDARHFDPATPQQLNADASGRRVHFTRLVDDDGMVSAPLTSTGLRLAKTEGVTWAAETGGPLRLETEEPLVYDAVLGTRDTFPGLFAAPLSAAERARCLMVPTEILPQVKDIVRRITQGMTDPQRKADAVQNFLMQNNRYSYAARPGPGDPVSDFVLHRRSGHCEYFASAATVLLRCAGVPTRYVIGYYAHEADGPGRLVVRGQDAHAWAESWIDGVGWVTVDATPANGRPPATARTPFWWKLRDRWQDFVLLVQRGLSGPKRWALLASLAAVLLLGAAVRSRRDRQASAPIFVYAAPPVLRELADRFEQQLAHRGIPCPPDRPWREHLALLAQGKATHPASERTHPGSFLATPEPPHPTPQREGGSAEGVTGGQKAVPHGNGRGAEPTHCPSPSPLGRGPVREERPNKAGRSFLAASTAFVTAYNRARFGDDLEAAQEAARALRELETSG